MIMPHSDRLIMEDVSVDPINVYTYTFLTEKRRRNPHQKNKKLKKTLNYH